MPPLSHSSKIPLLNFLLIESTISIKGPDSIIVIASHLKHTLGPFSLMLCGYYSPLWFVWVLAHPLITDVCSHFSHSNSHVLVSIFLDQCFQSRTYESLWWIQQKKKVILKFLLKVSLIPSCFTLICFYHTCVLIQEYMSQSIGWIQFIYHGYAAWAHIFYIPPSWRKYFINCVLEIEFP